MSTVTPEEWRVDGLNITSFAHWPESVDGIDVIAGRRQPLWHIPFRQGTPEIWDAPVEGKRISLDMIVGNTDADGNVTHAGGRRAHLRENINNLISAFAKRDGTPIVFARDVPAVPGPGVTTITANVVPVRQSTFTEYLKAYRRITIGLYMPWPYWVGGPVTIPTMSPATFEVDGNAPTWPTITFNEPGRLTHSSGQWIESTEAGLVVDCKNKTRSMPAALSVSGADWFRLDPGENHVDGPSVEIVFHPQWQ